MWCRTEDEETRNEEQTEREREKTNELKQKVPQDKKKRCERGKMKKQKTDGRQQTRGKKWASPSAVSLILARGQKEDRGEAAKIDPGYWHLSSYYIGTETTWKRHKIDHRRMMDSDGSKAQMVIEYTLGEASF